MTYTETCEHFARLSASKVAAMKRSPLGFGVGALLAGAYIGIAFILALTCSAGLPAGVRPLVNGSVFGLGLLLVVFSGAELFTGHVMYMAFGVAKRRISLLDALAVWVFVWIGNLIGATILMWLFAKGGGGAIYAAPTAFLHDYVTKKETSGVLALFCRAILCNWLVCLALWAPARLRNEAAKIWAMAWCLLAFVACGFEHSVANMGVIAMGLFDPARAGTLYGGAYNLLWVTLGNIVGGALLVAGAYMAASTADAEVPPPGAEAARQD